MSNRLYFTYHKFQPLNDDGTPRTDMEESYAFSLYDDYVEHTDWSYKTFEEVKKKVRLENMIAFLEDLPGSLSDLAECAGEGGMNFCGNEYTGEELLKLQKSK